MNELAQQTFLTASAMSDVTLTVGLVIIGMVALAAELFILPGFGIAGILGILILLGGTVSAWVQFGPLWGGVAILGTLAGATAMVVITFKSKTMRNRFVLDTRLQKGGGTESQDLAALVGKTGTAATDLRPSGMAVVDGERIDVVSEGGYIVKGQRIKVIEIDGPRVVVTRID